MSLAALQGTPRRHAYYARGCGFGQWAASLPPGDRTVLEQILPLNSGWTHAGIAAHITADPDYPGVSFTAERVAYHRNGECTCVPR